MLHAAPPPMFRYRLPTPSPQSLLLLHGAGQQERARLRASPLKFTPGWAAGSFFVPVVWWFWPYQALAEAWRAADVEHQTPWQHGRVTPLLPLWWGGWILQSTLGVVVPVLWGRQAELPQVTTILRIGVVQTSISVATAVLCIALVQKLAARHKRKAEHLGRPAA